MKILKANLSFEEGDGTIYTFDVIEFEGKHWIVVQWQLSRAAKKQAPARIVCLDLLPNQRLPGGIPADFVLHSPVPRSVFQSGIAPKGKEGIYVVKDNPEIFFPFREAMH